MVERLVVTGLSELGAPPAFPCQLSWALGFLQEPRDAPGFKFEQDTWRCNENQCFNPIGSMGLVYLPTFGWVFMVDVGIYIPYMDPMGMVVFGSPQKAVYKWKAQSGNVGNLGGFSTQRCLEFSPWKIGGDDPIPTSIFFKWWVGSTTN